MPNRPKLGKPDLTRMVLSPEEELQERIFQTVEEKNKELTEKNHEILKNISRVQTGVRAELAMTLEKNGGFLNNLSGERLDNELYRQLQKEDPGMLRSEVEQGRKSNGRFHKIKKGIVSTIGMNDFAQEALEQRYGKSKNFENQKNEVIKRLKNLKVEDFHENVDFKEIAGLEGGEKTPLQTAQWLKKAGEDYNRIIVLAGTEKTPKEILEWIKERKRIVTRNLSIKDGLKRKIFYVQEGGEALANWMEGHANKSEPTQKAYEILKKAKNKIVGTMPLPKIESKEEARKWQMDNDILLDDTRTLAGNSLDEVVLKWLEQKEEQFNKLVNLAGKPTTNVEFFEWMEMKEKNLGLNGFITEELLNYLKNKEINLQELRNFEKKYEEARLELPSPLRDLIKIIESNTKETGKIAVGAIYDIDDAVNFISQMSEDPDDDNKKIIQEIFNITNRSGLAAEQDTPGMVVLMKKLKEKIAATNSSEVLAEIEKIKKDTPKTPLNTEQTEQIKAFKEKLDPVLKEAGLLMENIIKSKKLVDSINREIVQIQSELDLEKDKLNSVIGQNVEKINKEIGSIEQEKNKLERIINEIEAEHSKAISLANEQLDNLAEIKEDKIHAKEKHIVKTEKEVEAQLENLLKSKEDAVKVKKDEISKALEEKTKLEVEKTDKFKRLDQDIKELLNKINQEKQKKKSTKLAYLENNLEGKKKQKQDFVEKIDQLNNRITDLAKDIDELEKEYSNTKDKVETELDSKTDIFKEEISRLKREGVDPKYKAELEAKIAGHRKALLEGFEAKRLKELESRLSTLNADLVKIQSQDIHSDRLTDLKKELETKNKEKLQTNNQLEGLKSDIESKSAILKDLLDKNGLGDLTSTTFEDLNEKVYLKLEENLKDSNGIRITLFEFLRKMLRNEAINSNPGLQKDEAEIIATVQARLEIEKAKSVSVFMNANDRAAEFVSRGVMARGWNKLKRGVAKGQDILGIEPFNIRTFTAKRFLEQVINMNPEFEGLKGINKFTTGIDINRMLEIPGKEVSLEGLERFIQMLEEGLTHFVDAGDWDLENLVLTLKKVKLKRWNIKFMNNLSSAGSSTEEIFAKMLEESRLEESKIEKQIRAQVKHPNALWKTLLFKDEIKNALDNDVELYQRVENAKMYISENKLSKAQRKQYLAEQGLTQIFDKMSTNFRMQKYLAKTKDIVAEIIGKDLAEGKKSGLKFVWNQVNGRKIWSVAKFSVSNAVTEAIWHGGSYPFQLAGRAIIGTARLPGRLFRMMSKKARRDYIIEKKAELKVDIEVINKRINDIKSINNEALPFTWDKKRVARQISRLEKKIAEYNDETEYLNKMAEKDKIVLPGAAPASTATSPAAAPAAKPNPSKK